MEGECLETHNIYKNIVTEIDDIEIVTDAANILASEDIKDDETENSGILIEDYVSCDKIEESKTSTSYCQPLQSVKSETNSRECSAENIAQKINQVTEFSNNGSDEMSHINYLQKVAFDSLDEGVPDENDIYNRFYFESDHLALKVNPDYRLLLQTLVALEAQRKQAVKDYENLIKLRDEALAEPIKFVEKLQNNESLGIPARQNIIKVPQINWETYSGTIEDFSQFGLLHQHNTRHSAVPNLDKANQKWEEQSTTSNGSIADSSQESFRLTSNIDTSQYVRGKLLTSDKSATFNQPWTAEEQRKLERLLQVYPQEAVEAKRWGKIADGLGIRTPKQVASRVQKYFIKLAKAGLPIPGRLPNLNRVLSKVPRPRNAQQQQHVVSFRNSTFFPSYQPRVYMDDNEKSDGNSIATSDDLADISDDETIPEELRSTKEYQEFLQIKRLLKRRRNGQQMTNKDITEHRGFMCDSCGMNPIVGVRWHCLDCPTDTSNDYCSDCVNKKGDNINCTNHKMEPVDWIASDFIDGDYIKLGESSKGYNYLDPNFLPAAT